MRTCCLVAILFGLPPLCVNDAPQTPGFRLPPGFVIDLYADQKLADDIYCLTIDPKGCVVVAGRGYIRLLVDDDGDGHADRAIQFSDAPKDGAQGLLWEGTTLYAVGDGGLHRWEDKNGDGVADGPGQLLRKFHTGGEHDAHTLRRGPDGWLYLLCGNNASIGKAFVTSPRSPIKEPVAGCVVRFSPDFAQSEIVADGFRNPYSMDFNLDQELFTFDSDNERCLGLPWYEPTRFYQVVPGGHYGWRSPQKGQTWRYPPYFPEVIAPTLTLGRGSPTAVECYRHTQFPARYRGSFFLADWTFGRIYHVRLHRNGASYRAEAGVFLEAQGENGFAPTAMAVHPGTGDLFVATGGRGTRGAVYRIRYVGPSEEKMAAKQPPPIFPLAWDASQKPALLRSATEEDLLQRRRTLDTLFRHQEHFDTEQLLTAITASAECPDRTLRQAMIRLLQVVLRRGARQPSSPSLPARQHLLWLAAAQTLRPLTTDELVQVIAWLTQPKLETALRMEAVRLLQRSLGEIGQPRAEKAFLEGYSLRSSVPLTNRGMVITAVRQSFPSGNAELDRELARTLALLHTEDSACLAAVTQKLTVQSDPLEDFHYLIVLSQLRGPRSAAERQAVALALLRLEKKMRARRLAYDRHWPLRMQELAKELCARDPLVPLALLEQPEFGRPEHVLLVQGPAWDRKQTAQRFWRLVKSEPQYPLTPEVIELLGELPREEIVPHLRQHWEEWGLRDAILRILAKQPQAEDRSRFLEGLNSPGWNTVRQAAHALLAIPGKPRGADYLAVLRALHRLPESKESQIVRGELILLLRHWSGLTTPMKDYAAWLEWFRQQYPQEAAGLDQIDGVDLAAWKQRLPKVDWSRSSTERGALLFRKTGCAQCHSGGRSLGPDLHGITRRFSREDVFTAIVQPSRDVSPRYKASIVLTQEGKVYHGSIVYQAVDGLLLQTDATTTVRIAGSQIESVRPSDLSLMPAGLLDRCTDQDLADLYAYLRTLQATAKKE
jgi:putative membrane-bound dehydrogenase-like protein